MLPHGTKKPGCGPEIMLYFLSHPETGVTHPSQIAVVGDRLTTDVMLANLMGSYAVWVKDGILPREETSIVSSSLRAMPWHILSLRRVLNLSSSVDLDLS